MDIKSLLRASGYFILLALLMNACVPSVGKPAPTAPVTIPLLHSFKGYELYSWQVDKEWNFTLITGTNRLKSYEEITSNDNIVPADGWVKIRVQGVVALQAVFKGLPKHEDIFWIGKYWLEQAQSQAGPITLPPREMIEVVEESCKQLDLVLTVSN